MSAAPQMSVLLKYKLIFQRGPLAGQTFAFEKAMIQIGRGSENDLILTDDLRASRQHAEIVCENGVLKIVNTSSKNFLVINGSEQESAVLETGSVVLVGESEFRVDIAAPEAPKTLDEPKTKLVVVEVNASPVPRPFSEVQPPFLQPTAATPLSTAPSTLAGNGFAPSRPISNVAGAGGFPHSQSPQRPRSRTSAPPSQLDSSKVRFYGLIIVIGAVIFWLMNSNVAKKKELSFRSSEQIEKDIESSKEEIKEFEARKDRLDNVQYRRAQENYIRGFRDYKQGNYGRARESFQVVLNLDPDNELAKRYYHLSKVKFDEMVKFHMLQGNRYREKKNWRMCRASYFNVMTMVNNSQDPLFKEAKQYLNQCSLAQQGTY